MADASAGQEPIINIRGERVGLGPRHASMLDAMTRWINDSWTAFSIGIDPRPMTRLEEEAWLVRIPDGDEVTFAIYDLADMAVVGSSQLFDIDHRHHTCELGIAILDPSRRGRGLGTEAVRLVTDYAFQDLGMHTVRLRTNEFNWAGRRAYARAGFREYGRRREARLHDENRWDVIYMEVLATEWERPAVRVMRADKRGFP